MDRLDILLRGATDGGTDWKGHQLPLSTGRWRPPTGRVMLAGDAARLVNPMTGEGTYDAVSPAAWLSRHGRVVDAGLRASASDRRVFDDLIGLGLARGRITTTMARGLIRELARHTRSPRCWSGSEETPPCES